LIDEFEQIYTKLKSKGKNSEDFSDSISTMLNEVSLIDDMFDSAAALETRINETMIEREELKEDHIS